MTQDIENIGEEILLKLEEINEKVDHLLIDHFLHKKEGKNGHECSIASRS
jgi:hypothetical protein